MERWDLDAKKADGNIASESKPLRLHVSARYRVARTTFCFSGSPTVGTGPYRASLTTAHVTPYG